MLARLRTRGGSSCASVCLVLLGANVRVVLSCRERQVLAFYLSQDRRGGHILGAVTRNVVGTDGHSSITSYKYLPRPDSV